MDESRGRHAAPEDVPAAPAGHDWPYVNEQWEVDSPPFPPLWRQLIDALSPGRDGRHRRTAKGGG